MDGEGESLALLFRRASFSSRPLPHDRHVGDLHRAFAAQGGFQGDIRSRRRSAAATAADHAANRVGLTHCGAHNADSHHHDERGSFLQRADADHRRDDRSEHAAERGEGHSAAD